MIDTTQNLTKHFNAPTTVKDIALIAGVSVSTVSRYLNNSGYVGKQAATKIEHVIKATGFVVNSAARSLVLNKTNLLGVIMPTFENPIYFELLKGLNEQAEQHGYSVVIGQRGETKDKLKESMMHLASLKVDGIVMTTPENLIINEEEYLSPFIKKHIPVVQLGKQNEKMGTDGVSENSIDSGKQIGTHLARMGHKRVSIIGNQENYFVKERVRGFKIAYLEHGLPVDGIQIYPADFTRSGGYLIAKELLSDKRNAPSAIFALNDVMAIGALMAAEELCYEIPNQLAIIGIDGIDLCNVVRPRLSTLVLPIREIGTELFSLLYTRMTGDYTGSSRHKIFSGRLSIQESTFQTKSI